MSGPEIIYEDEDFLAVNKPAGLVVHGFRVKGQGSMVAEPTLVDWLLQKYPEIAAVGDDPTIRPGIVHRLDKETSGVMLVARNQKSFEYLKSLFATGQIKKTYLALVFGKTPREGIIQKPIGIKNGTLKRSVRSEKMAKSAITEYKTINVVKLKVGEREEFFSLLEIFPKTGRTHQIRVHLASIGHPVVGDRLYGPKKQPSWATRLMLHALSVEFTKEEGGRVRFEAEPPEEFGIASSE